MPRPVGPKVGHVLRARQTRDHECHWPGCTKQVPPAMWGCRKHWYMLPKGIRDEIWAAYEIGQEVNITPSPAYLRAVKQAILWIRKNYPNG